MARSNINQRLNGLNPLAYLGDNAYQPPEFLGETRAPTINDTNFELGTLWLDRTDNPPTAEDVWMLVSLVQNRATWVNFAGGISAMDTLTGDSGGPVVPTAGNINVIAGRSTLNSGATVRFTGSGSILTFNTTDASSNTIIGKSAGNLTLSGTNNTSLGDSASIALTTGSNNTVVGYLAGSGLTSGSSNVIIGDGAGVNITTTDNNIIIGTTGIGGDADTTRIGFGQNQCFVAGINGITPSQNDAEVVIVDSTGQLGSLSSSTAGFVLTSNGLTNPSFQAVSASGAVTSVSGGNNITITGTATAPIVNVSGTTDHAVQVGNASNSLTSIAVGATNTVLLGNTGADPSFGAVPNAALSNSSITLTSGTGISITGSPVSLGGAATVNLSVPVSIANGGTNATSMAVTDGTVYFDGTRLVTTATGTSGWVFTSQGAGLPPEFAPGAGSTGSSILGTEHTSISSGITQWASPGFGPFTSTQADAQFIAPVSGTASKFYMNVTANASTTNVTVTLNVNSVNTALVITITALTTGVFSDLVNTVAVTAGDLIQFEASGGTTGSVVGTVSMKFTA